MTGAGTSGTPPRTADSSASWVAFGLLLAMSGCVACSKANQADSAAQRASNRAQEAEREVRSLEQRLRSLEERIEVLERR